MTLKLNMYKAYVVHKDPIKVHPGEVYAIAQDEESAIERLTKDGYVEVKILGMSELSKDWVR